MHGTLCISSFSLYVSLSSFCLISISNQMLDAIGGTVENSSSKECSSQLDIDFKDVSTKKFLIKILASLYVRGYFLLYRNVATKLKHDQLMHDQHSKAFSFHSYGIVQIDYLYHFPKQYI